MRTYALVRVCVYSNLMPAVLGVEAGVCISTCVFTLEYVCAVVPSVLAKPHILFGNLTYLFLYEYNLLFKSYFPNPLHTSKDIFYLMRFYLFFYKNSDQNIKVFL